MLQNLSNAIILGTIQNVISAYNEQLSRYGESGQQILFGTFAAFKELMALWHKDAIIEETRILPATASAKEESQYMDQDCSSTFDKLMMLAAMLVEDNQPEERICQLGTTTYVNSVASHNNPYDYSWFDGEVECSGKTMLEYVVDWYNAYDQNKMHFSRYYNLARALGMTPDMVWDFIQTSY